MKTQALPQTVFGHRIKEKLYRFYMHLALIAIAFLFFAPLVLIISGSFTTSSAIDDFGYRLIPRQITLEAYRFIFYQPEKIARSYLVSSLVTLIGTGLGTLFTAMIAYTLSRKNFFLRKVLSFAVVFTMLFNGGIVPLYILVTRYLKLNDTLWALILPLLINPFLILILRTFFKEIPQDYFDAAMLDGAGEMQIFTNIIIPLAKPAIITTAMMYLLIYWNDWFLALLFISKPELYPLQYMLHQVLANAQFLQQNIHNVSSADLANLMLETMRMAMAVVAIGPITLLLVFFQKYFVQGMTIGGIKE
jgi:putative aldouronate transport system permease protein